LDSFQPSELANKTTLWALLEFESAIPVPPHSKIIASKLDADISFSPDLIVQPFNLQTSEILPFSFQWLSHQKLSACFSWKDP